MSSVIFPNTCLLYTSSPEADRAGLNLNIYWAFAEGFLKETAPALTEAEVATLGNSCFTPVSYTHLDV